MSINMKLKTFKAKFFSISSALIAVFILTNNLSANVNFANKAQTGSFADLISGNSKAFRAESAALSSKVRLLSDDTGISKVKIVLTEPDGNRRMAISNPFGYYRFDNLTLGGIYNLQVSAKGYQDVVLILNVTEPEQVFDIILSKNPD